MIRALSSLVPVIGVSSPAAAQDARSPAVASDAVSLSGALSPPAGPPAPPSKVDRQWQDEVLYFVMVDRFANGDRSNDQGIDPTHPERFHGGDWQGVIDHLDELDRLGVTTLWLSPAVLNDTDFLGMQGYHGYWVQDFYKPDPHLGDMAKMKELVEKAHARGMKVVLDLIVNHTGYNHPWVNDPAKHEWFHHEGDIKFFTEAAMERGSLRGLPDLAQENPEVSRYLMDMAKYWVRETGIDGFRVDAVKHVPKQWLKDFADEMHREFGPQFFMVGEAYSGDPYRVAPYQNEAHLDSLFDFPVSDAARSAIGTDEKSFWGRLKEAWDCAFQHPYEAWRLLTKSQGSMESLAAVFQEDDQYARPDLLATILDNHDMPRFGSIAGENAREKLKLGLAFMLTARGIPTLYQGTEDGMGLNGEGNRDDKKFGQDPELFSYISKLAHLRQDSLALRRGKQVQLEVDRDVFAYARVHEDDNVIVLLNRGGDDEKRKIDLAGKVDLAPDATLTDVLTGEKVCVQDGVLRARIPARGALVLRA